MAYVTPADVRGVSSPDGGDTPSTSDKATPAMMTDAQLALPIAQAQAVVDAYIAGVISEPIADPVPELVKTLVAFEAAYLAELTLRKTKDLEKDDPFRLRHDWVMVQLSKIATGEITLPGNDVSGLGGAEIYNQYEGSLWLPQDFDMREVPPVRPYV